jgi:CubicO group peptidase (beta-lactamase class C family)
VVRGGASLRVQRALVTRSLFAVPPAAPNYSTTTYSNAAYITVGALVERKAGMSWETLMQRALFGPLAMRTAGFGAPGQAGGTGQTRGHVEDSTGLHAVPWTAGADNPPVTGPAGAVHAFLPDWSRFIAAILRGANGDSSYLSRAQWRRVLEPVNDRADYVLGWKCVRDATEVGFTLEHLGSNGFWLAQASLDPARGVAVLLTANAAVDRLEQPFLQLRQVLADSAVVWCGRASRRAEGTTSARGAHTSRQTCK